MTSNPISAFIQRVFNKDTNFQDEVKIHIGNERPELATVDLNDVIKVEDYKKGPPEEATIKITFSGDKHQKFGGGRDYGEIPLCNVGINRNPTTNTTTLEMLDNSVVESDFDK